MLFLLFCITVAGSAIRRDVDIMEANKGVEGLVEGDIRMTDEQLQNLNGNRVKRQIIRYGTWTGGVVNYYFEDAFSQAKRDLMKYALEHISNRTCVKFVESSTERNRIKFVSKGGGCSSFVGMMGIFVHEVMHSLGVHHTMSRSDRDEYVTVNFTMIPERYLHNMQIEYGTFNAVPYEYGSAMHYRGSSLGVGSLTAKQLRYQKTMGNMRISFYDMVNINTLYSCSCAMNLDCKNGGYTNPSNCDKCVCPAGYAGRLCDEAPPGALLYTATPNWTEDFIEFGYNDGSYTNTYLMAYAWISAPADKQIEVKIQQLVNVSCFDSCDDNGVEVKVDEDPRIVNPIYCCNTDTSMMQTVVLSKLNPTPIVMHQRRGKSGVTISYKYVDTPPVTTTTITSTTTKPPTQPTTTTKTRTTPPPAPTTRSPTTEEPETSCQCTEECHFTSTETETCQCTTSTEETFENEECEKEAGTIHIGTECQANNTAKCIG
ncbi:hypothetical protein GCK72_016736 [Caenorhabditis remanei]|uniref:Zinc metalloproteinase n=1 Tax=Caenorhabditis remanei TaxID=31234 RepID=A0A6A5G6T1_CAERE|nr:hypothetical protein GCK72_016736 [Caenorhabditis remanei]KAF1750189.1 hypothetical protein GCK72_016736 [Caenorhabditis remanei]